MQVRSLCKLHKAEIPSLAGDFSVRNLIVAMLGWDWRRVLVVCASRWLCRAMLIV